MTSIPEFGPLPHGAMPLINWAVANRIIEMREAFPTPIIQQAWWMVTALGLEPMGMIYILPPASIYET